MPEGRCGQCTGENVCACLFVCETFDCCCRDVNYLTDMCEMLWGKAAGKLALRSRSRVETLPANSLQVRLGLSLASDVFVHIRKICFCIVLPVEQKDLRH